MSRDYPYVQDTSKPKQGTCSICKEQKIIITLEWRVDYFQGNCEFEDICKPCIRNRNNEERKKREAYFARMEPIWEKQRQKREVKEEKVREIVKDMGFDIREYDNGQWCIGGLIDWWTTTGTAIERKSGNRHYLSFDRPDEIKKVLLSFYPSP